VCSFGFHTQTGSITANGRYSWEFSSRRPVSIEQHSHRSDVRRVHARNSAFALDALDLCTWIFEEYLYQIAQVRKEIPRGVFDQAAIGYQVS
jgi:hypothetical protein